MKFFITLIFLLFAQSVLAIETKAPYAILVDYNTGKILFEKNSDTMMAPSSMSKLMTIYVIFEKLKNNLVSLTDQLTVSEKAWRKQGSKMFLKLNSKVSVEDLLLGVIVQSGNDACITLSEGIMGSEIAFTEEMNRKAQELGLVNSVFKNSSGWPEDGHLMTVRDLYILSKRLIQDFPEYYHYFSVKEYLFNGIKQENRNTLLAKNIGVDGLKTGHADEAGYGIAASSMINGRRLLLVINGMDSMKSREQEAEYLFNYGFLNFTNIVAAKANQVVDNAEVLMGKSKFVSVITHKDIVVTAPIHDAKKVKITKEYTHLEAPIKKGSVLGIMIVETPDDKQTTNLYAAEDVEELSFFSRIINKIKYYLSGLS